MTDSSDFAASCAPFAEAAVCAFPMEVRDAARHAVHELAAAVDGSYRQPSEHVHVRGDEVGIPSRLHFKTGAPELGRLDRLSIPARCLLTRSTDGHLRQRALATIIDAPLAWVVPFVALLIGGYVVEIVRDIQVALPRLDQALYASFVQENRRTIRLLRARAMSYWDCYYRLEYPNRGSYPGLAVLHELETWLSVTSAELDN